VFDQLMLHVVSVFVWLSPLHSEIHGLSSRHNSLNIFLFQWHHEIVVLCSEGGFVFADAGGGYV
jgi:hypothetical protein